MTSRLTPRITYTIAHGDTAKTRFDFAFKIYKDSDLKVVLSNGIAPSAYSVHISQNTDGGYIQLAQGLAAGTKITLYRDMAFVRQTQFRENRDFRASVMNEEFDRMVMLVQQVGLRVKDAVRLTASDTHMDMMLPTAQLRANKVLAFDAQGRIQVRQDISDSIKIAERHATDAKNAVVITDRNKRQIEQYINNLDLTIYAKKSALGSAAAKDIAFFVPSTDVGNGHHQIAKTDTDFKAKSKRIIGNSIVKTNSGFTDIDGNAITLGGKCEVTRLYGSIHTQTTTATITIGSKWSDYDALVFEAASTYKKSGYYRAHYTIFNNRTRPVDSPGQYQAQSWILTKVNNDVVYGRFIADTQVQINSWGNASLSQIFGIQFK